MQARTKVFGMRRETAAQCVTGRGGGSQKSQSGTPSKKDALKMAFRWAQWPIAFFIYFFVELPLQSFSWLCQEKRKTTKKKKEPLTIDSADEAVKLVPVVLETAKPAKSPA